MSMPLILASGSMVRQDLLRKAGVSFEVVKPRVDEESIKASLIAEGETPRDIADQLADAKARKVALKKPGRMVLGCDQVLAMDGTFLSKPKDPVEARAHLDLLTGQTHRLISAAVIYDDTKPVWRHIGIVKLSMRHASSEYLDGYVRRNWDSIRHSVGGYKLEEEGVRLFTKIEGDFFHVLGIPLLEVLAYLTLRGVIDG